MKHSNKAVAVKATHKTTPRKTATTQTAKNEFPVEGFNALPDEQQEIILELIKGFAILYPRDKAERKPKREARK